VSAETLATPLAYRNGALHVEDVPLATLADRFGTPLYCMSEARLRAQFARLRDALAGIDFEICYAPKANSSLAVLRTLAGMGAGVDAVSEGELRLALAAGVPARRVIFEGPGKSDSEIAFAVSAGIGQFTVESEAELQVLDSHARRAGRRTPAALRVNPDVDAGGHQKISTGRAGDKFGIPIQDVPALYARAAGLPGIEMIGLSMHIGSQVPDLAPFKAAYGRLAALVRQVRASGGIVERIDIGGGLGVDYGDGAVPPCPARYGELVRSVFSGCNARIVSEPGRFLTAGAGLLLARALWCKRSGGRRILVVDAGMNDLQRPALYNAHHRMLPVCAPPPGAEREPTDIVGPICETGDCFARARPFPDIGRGDLIAILDVGAYGASMASEYNARPRVAELMVSEGRFALTRARATYEEMTARERIPAWMQKDA